MLFFLEVPDWHPLTLPPHLPAGQRGLAAPRSPARLAHAPWAACLCRGARGDPGWLGGLERRRSLPRVRVCEAGYASAENRSETADAFPIRSGLSLFSELLGGRFILQRDPLA